LPPLILPPCYFRLRYALFFAAAVIAFSFYATRLLFFILRLLPPMLMMRIAAICAAMLPRFAIFAATPPTPRHIAAMLRFFCAVYATRRAAMRFLRRYAAI